MDNDLTILQSQLNELSLAVISYLPSLIGGVLIFLIGRWIAGLVRKFVVRAGIRVGFDKVINQTGITGGLEQADIKQSPLELLATFVYWLILLNILLIALDTLQLSPVADPLRDFIDFLPQILVAIVILIGGALVAQSVGRVVQAAMAGIGVELHEAVGQLVRFLLLIIVIVIALEHLGLDVTLFTNLITTMIAIAFAGLALAFGLGGRGLARNVLAGFYARDVYAQGDTIVINEEEGILIGIGSMNSEVLINDVRLVIPNTQLTETEVRVKVQSSNNAREPIED